MLDSLEAFDINACADICSSFHPRCDGVTFDGATCQLYGRASAATSRPSRRHDAALGIFPAASSNCATLGASQQAAGSNFAIMCGSVIAGFDLSQNFAPTFQDCMGQCAATTGCAAVSFDPSLDQGFKNCYLKTTMPDQSAIAADARTDTAMIQNAAANPAPAAPAGQGVATIPLPAPTTSGAVFFTPPGQNTPPPAEPAPSLEASPTPVMELLPTGTTGTAAASSSTMLPPLFFPSSSAGAGGSILTATVLPEAPAAEAEAGGETSSNAWIAAPVVGSVAAIALIVLSFIMLKRRRLGNRGTSSSSSSSTDGSLQPHKRNISRPMAISAFFTSWFSSSAGRRGSGGGVGGDRSRSRSRSRMGNFSEVAAKQQPASRSSMRTSVTGLLRPGVAMGGMERLDDVEEAGSKRNSTTPQYDVRNGRMELRNSLNGLQQNRWS